MENIYKIPIKFVLLSGVDIFLMASENSSKYVKTMEIVMFLNLFLVLIATLQIYIFFFDSENDVKQRFSNLTFMCVGIESITKFIGSVWQREKIMKIISDFIDIHSSLEKDEKQSFHLQTKWLKNFSLIFGMSYVITLMLFNTTPILIMLSKIIINGQTELLSPYFFWWPFAIDGKFFFITYFYQVYTGWAVTLNSIGMDLIFYNAMCNIATLYEILNVRLENFLNRKILNKNELKELVAMNLKIDKQCKSLDRILGIQVFVHILVASLIICTTGIIVMTQEDAVIISKFCSILITNLCNTFILCWFGNRVEIMVGI